MQFRVFCFLYGRKQNISDKRKDDKQCPNLYVRLCHIVLTVICCLCHIPPTVYTYRMFTEVSQSSNMIFDSWFVCWGERKLQRTENQFLREIIYGYAHTHKSRELNFYRRLSLQVVVFLTSQPHTDFTRTILFDCWWRIFIFVCFWHYYYIHVSLNRMMMMISNSTHLWATVCMCVVINNLRDEWKWKCNNWWKLVD